MPRGGSAISSGIRMASALSAACADLAGGTGFLVPPPAPVAPSASPSKTQPQPLPGLYQHSCVLAKLPEPVDFTSQTLPRTNNMPYAIENRWTRARESLDAISTKAWFSLEYVPLGSSVRCGSDELRSIPRLPRVLLLSAAGHSRSRHRSFSRATWTHTSATRSAHARQEEEAAEAAEAAEREAVKRKPLSRRRLPPPCSASRRWRRWRWHASRSSQRRQ